MASSRMNVGQLFHGDVDEARKKLKHLGSKIVSVTQPSMQSHPKGTRRLKVVGVEDYKTVKHTLLDTGGDTNLTS